MVDRIAKINIFSIHPSITIHICDDFNIHHKEWLVHSSSTYEDRKYCCFLHILRVDPDRPTRAPDTAGHHANLLDLFLASCFDQCSAKVLPSWALQITL